MKFLVIGAGSIGERHIKNLKLLGHEVFVYDIDADRMQKMVETYSCQVLDFNAYHVSTDGWIICTPPSYHISFCQEALKHNSNIFVEKPLSHNLDHVESVLSEAKSKRLIVQVGYQFRFNSALQQLKNLIDRGTIGRVMSIRAEVGQYLPDWHPQEDYHKLYTCYEELGGGIIGDASHEIDYVMWLADSKVRTVSCMCDKLSDLDMDCEDTAEINLRFDNKIIANIHLDCTQRSYSRWCKVIGTEGTILWTYPDNISIRDKNNHEDIGVYSPCDMYLEEMKHFVDCIKNHKNPIMDGLGGKDVLEVIIAAKKSNTTKTVIEL